MQNELILHPYMVVSIGRKSTAADVPMKELGDLAPCWDSLATSPRKRSSHNITLSKSVKILAL